MIETSLSGKGRTVIEDTFPIPLCAIFEIIFAKRWLKQNYVGIQQRLIGVNFNIFKLIAG